MKFNTNNDRTESKTENKFSMSLSDNKSDGTRSIKINGIGTYFSLKEDNGNYSVQPSKPIHTILKKVSLSNFNSMMEKLKEMYPDSEVTFNPNSVDGGKEKFEKRYLGDKQENKDIVKNISKPESIDNKKIALITKKSKGEIVDKNALFYIEKTKDNNYVVKALKGTSTLLKNLPKEKFQEMFNQLRKDNGDKLIDFQYNEKVSSDNTLTERFYKKFLNDFNVGVKNEKGEYIKCEKKYLYEDNYIEGSSNSLENPYSAFCSAYVDAYTLRDGSPDCDNMFWVDYRLYWQDECRDEVFVEKRENIDVIVNGDKSDADERNIYEMLKDTFYDYGYNSPRGKQFREHQNHLREFDEEMKKKELEEEKETDNQSKPLNDGKTQRQRDIEHWRRTKTETWFPNENHKDYDPYW